MRCLRYPSLILTLRFQIECLLSFFSSKISFHPGMFVHPLEAIAVPGA